MGDALFVHGGVQPEAIGFVPDASAPVNIRDGSASVSGGSSSGGSGGGGGSCGVDEWIDGLNTFAKRQVEAWIDDCDRCYGGGGVDRRSSAAQGSAAAQGTASPGSSGPSWEGSTDRAGFGFFDRPGGGLIRYGMATMPDGSKSPTVVYSSFLVDGHPVPAKASVVTALSEGGIRAVVTGHQPHGDSPVVMRCEAGEGSEDELLVITADTSFSKSTKWAAAAAGEAAGDAATAAKADDAEADDATPASGDPPVATVRPGFGNPRGPPPPPSPDPRGHAVVEVLLRPRLRDGERYEQKETDAGSRGGGGGGGGDGVSSGPSDGAGGVWPAYARVHGVLSTGEAIDCAIEAREAAEQAVANQEAAAAQRRMVTPLAVGQAVGGGRWWVKGRMPGGWLLSRGEGYDVHNIVVPEEQVEQVVGADSAI